MVNPADISKVCGYQQVWEMLQEMLIREGDTAELYDKHSICRARGE